MAAPLSIQIVTKGKFRQLLLENQDVVAGAATDSIHDVVNGLKRDVRAHIRANFKRGPASLKKYGQNFPNAFQVEGFPSIRSKKVSLRAAAQLYVIPKFTEIFATGGPVRPLGKYLAIPLPAAVRAGLDRMIRASNRLFGGAGPARFQKFADLKGAALKFGKLRLIPGKNRGFVLAADKGSGAGKARAGTSFVPLFAFVRSIELPKKIDIRPIIDKWRFALPGLFSARAARRKAARERAAKRATVH